MSDNNGWPDPVFRFGVPLNPERDQFHWLIRKNGQCPEAWRWDPDADGCGTEYSGAWAESEGDGQPEDMGKWYRYLGPCLTPAEVESHKHAAVIAYANLLNLPAPPNLIAQARRDALEEAARREMPPEFLDWMKRQMPTDTIIGNPEWWAGRIWRAAIHAMKKGEGNE